MGSQSRAVLPKQRPKPVWSYSSSGPKEGLEVQATSDFPVFCMRYMSFEGFLCQLGWDYLAIVEGAVQLLFWAGMHKPVLAWEREAR